MSGPIDDGEQAVRDRLIALIDGPTADAQSDAVEDVAAAAIAQPQPPTTRAADGWWGDLYALGNSDVNEAANETTAQPTPRPDRRRIQPWWTGRHADLTPGDENEPDTQLDAQPQPDEGDEPDADDARPDAHSHADEEDDDTGDATAQPGQDTDAEPKKGRPKLRIPTLLTRPASPAAGGTGPLIAAPAPRMSLLEAAANVPRRLRWLILHASAAAAGYRLGWVPYSTRTAAWIAAHGFLNVSSMFWVGCGIGCEFLRYRMRNHRLPIRWLAAVPISSIVIGTLFYGTGWQNLELPL